MTGHVDELTRSYVVALRGKIAAEIAFVEAREAFEKAKRDYMAAETELVDAIMDERPDR